MLYIFCTHQGWVDSMKHINRSVDSLLGAIRQRSYPATNEPHIVEYRNLICVTQFFMYQTMYHSMYTYVQVPQTVFTLGHNSISGVWQLMQQI